MMDIVRKRLDENGAKKTLSVSALGEGEHGVSDVEKALGAFMRWDIKSVCKTLLLCFIFSGVDG